jgi:cyclophilin family peptidyl-prolyl cis-trans isomerase
MGIRLQLLALLAALAWPASSVWAQNHAPTVIAPPAPVGLGGANGNSREVALDTIFADQDLLQLAGTEVNITTTSGLITIELFDADAPLTVQNFLAYIQANRYQSVFWHRSVPGFVIQTGGFNYVNNQVGSVTTFPPVVNEFHRSNVRGTVAMAKLSGDPNSATSQWFVNLVDNSANLDNQNGGFTVFGRLVEGTIAAADAIAAVPRYNFGSPFDSIPLRNYTGTITAGNFIFLTSLYAAPKITFTATPADPQVVSASVQGLTLHLVASHSGTTTLTLKATDFNGLSVQTTMQVTVAIVPRLLSITQDVQGTHVTFQGMSNTTYEIDSIDDMSGSSWQVLNAGLVSAADGTFVVVDQPPGGARFYRARQLP